MKEEEEGDRAAQLPSHAWIMDLTGEGRVERKREKNRGSGG